MIRINLLFTVYLLSSYCFGQQPNSKDFFPPVNEEHPFLYQKISIETDTIEYIYMTYEWIVEDEQEYLISTTYDQDSLIATYLKEKITRRGMRFESAETYKHDTLGYTYVIPVKGRKKITYPFKPLKNLKNKAIKWKTIHDNKIITRSTFTFQNTGSYSINGTPLTTFVMKRDVYTKYKKNFFKEKVYYSYTMHFHPDYGVVIYMRKGHEPLNGIIMESYYISDY